MWWRLLQRRLRRRRRDADAQIGRGLAESFNQRLARIAQDFAQQHVADQKLHKRRYTIVIGMRSWLFSVSRDLKRQQSSR